LSETVAAGARARGGLRGSIDAVLVYRERRMVSMLGLGFSAGLPFMLVFSTLSAWLRQSGIELATIGMLSWVGLVYSLKFLWAPFVDRLQLPILGRLLGRRRSWMLLAQLGIAWGLASIALSDPRAHVLHVAACALLVAFCSATQDIAIDAWRIESAPPSLQGAMAAAYQLGYRLAIMVASAGALWIAADFGWLRSYATMSALVLIGIVTTLLVREPAASAPADALLRERRVIEWLEDKAHWPQALRQAGGTFIGAVVCPLVDFFARYGWQLGLVIFAFIGTYRLTDYTMGSVANPFYLDLGFTLKQIAAVAKLYGTVLSVVGILVGGVAVARLGRTRSLVLGSALVIVSNLSYAILAARGVPSLVGLASVISLDNFAQGVHGTALIAFMSSLTSASYTATQYAVLSSLYALPGKLLMGTSGIVVDHIGYPPFFLYTAALSIPALVLLYGLSRRQDFQPLRTTAPI
jgi:MFS transporter, PAT family, beta-lactamase induction signal transducer AmpG